MSCKVWLFSILFGVIVQGICQFEHYGTMNLHFFLNLSFTIQAPAILPSLSIHALFCFIIICVVLEKENQTTM